VLVSYPNGQLITWIFQVMPLFFFAGGYANAASWEHRGDRSYAQWMWGRSQRLLRPLWGYLIVMVPVALVVGANASARISTPILIIATQLLWFLGIYLVITALTPVLTRMDLRYEGALITGALLSIALIDLARLNSAGGPIALLNFVFVWALLASLGMRYRRGLLTPRSGLLLAGTALAVNLLMVLGMQWYPRSMVGMPGDRFSNVAPPTLALTMHGIVVIGVIAALATPIRTLMSRARVWRTTEAINLVMMTIYLWHLPALMALILIERVIGFERPTEIVKGVGPIPAAGFWTASIVHWMAFIAIVLLVVRVLWPLEYLRLPWWDRQQSTTSPRRAATALAATGSVMAGVSLLMISATGLNLKPMRTIIYLGLPINSLVALGILGVGAGLIKWAGSSTAVTE
jgi:hypothetical protein